MATRRNTIKLLGMLPAGLYLQSLMGCTSVKDFPEQLGATVYKSEGTDIPDLTRRLLDSLGGIQSYIDKNDIVLLKPNSQWWVQGMTNTDVMLEFINHVLDIPGFAGEVIIVDNHQDTVSNSLGWTTDKPNGKYNLNDLVKYFNDNGHANVTKYHWHPAGPNPNPLQLKGSGDNVISHPSEGDGYIWPEDLYFECPHGNKCILSYPVFTSSYSGITIDLKDGTFQNGSYTNQPIKFINFSALNHHGPYAGVTASVKNLMGVVDMTCGFPGTKPDNFYNAHYIGTSFLFRLLTKYSSQLRDLPYYWDAHFHPSVLRFRYTGGVLGKFMTTIRKPDLNIVTAINIGWGHRTKTEMAYRANTVLASIDPVALDYTAASQVLLQATKIVKAPQQYLEFNDPSIEGKPFNSFLQECRRELGGTIDPEMIEVIDC